MRHSRTILVLALALAGFAAPASAAANKEHLQLMAEIRMLQEQQQMLQATLGTLQDTLKALNAKLDEQAASERKMAADQNLAVSNIRDGVRTLDEKTSETNVRISTVSQDLEALRQSLAAQQSQATAPSGATPAGATPAGAPGASGSAPAGTTPPPSGGAPTNPETTPSNPAAPAPPPGVSPQRLFDSSYDDYTAARYDLAIQGLTQFISYYPTFNLAARAQYTIGQSYFEEHKYTEARDAYQKVISNYPQQTNEVGEAYYKLGETYEQLKQIDDAKRAYQTVVDKYQSSDAAPLARQALDRLNR